MANRGTTPRPLTPLARWLNEKRVTAREIAKRVGKSYTTVSGIRQGTSPPSDAMKIAISLVTREIETELGVAIPIGVPVESWFPVESTRAGATKAAG